MPAIRPTCPKCSMNMILAKTTADEQIFECLRCGHTEKQKVEE